MENGNQQAGVTLTKRNKPGNSFMYVWLGGFIILVLLFVGTRFAIGNNPENALGGRWLCQTNQIAVTVDITPGGDTFRFRNPYTGRMVDGVYVPQQRSGSSLLMRALVYGGPSVDTMVQIIDKNQFAVALPNVQAMCVRQN